MDKKGDLIIGGLFALLLLMRKGFGFLPGIVAGAPDKGNILGDAKELAKQIEKIKKGGQGTAETFKIRGMALDVPKGDSVKVQIDTRIIKNGQPTKWSKGTPRNEAGAFQIGLDKSRLAITPSGAVIERPLMSAPIITPDPDSNEIEQIQPFIALTLEQASKYIKEL